MNLGIGTNFELKILSQAPRNSPTAIRFTPLAQWATNFKEMPKKRADQIPNSNSKNPLKVKSPSREELKSLIEQIGGAQALNAILEKFYFRMSTDTMIGFFFAGHDLSHIARKQGEFILMAAGLIDRFDGKGPSTAHAALPPILKGHFDRRLLMLRELLTEEQLAPDLIELWVSFEESFRQIVTSSTD